MNGNSWTNPDVRQRIKDMVRQHGYVFSVGYPPAVTMYTLAEDHRIVGVEYQRHAYDLGYAIDHAKDKQTIYVHVKSDDAADLALPSVAYTVRPGAVHMGHRKDMQARYERPVYEVAGYDGIFHFCPGEEAERDELCDRMRHDPELDVVAPGPFRLARVIKEQHSLAPATVPQPGADSAHEPATPEPAPSPVQARPEPAPVSVAIPAPARIPETAAPAIPVKTAPTATSSPVLDADTLRLHAADPDFARDVVRLMGHAWPGLDVPHDDLLKRGGQSRFALNSSEFVVCRRATETPSKGIKIAELYARHRGRKESDGRIGALELKLWTIRALIETGRATPADVTLPPLPPDARDALRKLYDGFALLCACRWRAEPGEPVSFAKRFAASWSGVPTPLVLPARRDLVNAGIIVPVGQGQTKGGMAVDLFLPGW